MESNDYLIINAAQDRMPDRLVSQKKKKDPNSLASEHQVELLLTLGCV